MSSRRIQHIFETYYENVYLQKDLSRSHLWKIYGQGTKFPRVNSLDIPKLFKNSFFKTIYEVTASSSSFTVSVNKESINKSSSKIAFLRF